MNLMKLSKEISYALRHNPRAYGLSLDSEGWADLSTLLDFLSKSNDFQTVTQSDIETIIKTSERQRFEIRNGKIRAFYGHSVKQVIEKEFAVPPSHLYHGTTEKAYESIKKTGLQVMQRQYVHLALDISTAKKIAERYTDTPVILKIHTAKAIEQGVEFYIGNDNIWLATTIPSDKGAIIKLSDL